MLFPQAVRHQTISSVSGSNSVKQIGQSPETSLRLDGALEEADVSDDAGAGAAANISHNSWRKIIVSGNSEVLGPTIKLTEERKASWY